MPIFILQGCLPAEPSQQPRVLEKPERHAAERIQAHFPEVRWLARYAVVGPFDYVDVFQAPDFESAARAAALVRRRGRVQANERVTGTRR